MSATELSIQPAPALRRKTTEHEARILRAALDSTNYREFIWNVATAQSRVGKPNISALSRKAGFSSRSFIGDVVDGRRRLSPSSYPMLARALSLPARLRAYFHLLVIRDEPDLNFEQVDSLCLEIRLKELRLRLQSDLETVRNKDKKAEALLKARDMMDCYAALGSGATLPEVAKRTGLSETYVAYVLEHFVGNSTAKKDGDRYVVDNPVVFFDDLGKNQNAKICYLQTLNELKRKADAGFHAADCAFSQFVFSVAPTQMPEFKRKLWDLMREFVESAESPDGDRIAKLAVGFYI